MSLTVQQLFQIAPSGVGQFQIAPSGSWLAQMLSVATALQLPTTSWQSGAPERTIFAVEAVMFMLSDVSISVMAQGGFLQSAASGSVTYTALDGTQITIPVTPDPSNAAQNPTGALGWLDLLTQSTFATTRVAAQYAQGPLAIAKITPGSIGPFAAGLYHVAAATGATYHNLSSLTIPSSVIAGTGGVVAAVDAGLVSSVITTQSPHGLAAGQSVYVSVMPSSGITGLAGVFALVASATTTQLRISVGSSGSYTSGGNVYLCTVAQMQADVAGLSSSVGPGQVNRLVTQNTGVSVSNTVAWSGANWESNAALGSRALLSLASRSPNGPSQAYEYFAESAVQLLSEQTPPYLLTNGPVTATTFSIPATGIVNTVVASNTPASSTPGANVTPGVSQLPISSITNANPAVITCTGPTSLTSGQSMTVTISGALGMTGIDGTYVGTYTGASSFSIPLDTTASGSYTGGGQVEGGDLGQIDLLLQRTCVPDNTTAITSSAVALPISVVATVVVPAAYVAQYTVNVNGQLQAQIDSYAVGGNAPTFAVGYDDIVGALEEAGVLVLGQASFVRQVQSLSVNGGVVDVAFPSPFYKAILTSPVVSVVGV